MLSKEEIEKANKFLKELEMEGYKYTALGQQKYIIENVFNKIEKLESDKQKLIEKLEKDLVNISKKINGKDYINNYRKIRLKAFKIKTKEILKILKGENDEYINR